MAKGNKTLKRRQERRPDAAQSLEERALSVDEGNPIQLEDIEAVAETEASSEVQESAAPKGPSDNKSHDSLDVSTLSAAIKYWVLSIITYGDCVRQKDADGVFDVLARNFESHGALSWWLNRINHGDKTKYAKGRDLIEYFRKVAHLLFKDLKEIGKPVARL